MVSLRFNKGLYTLVSDCLQDALPACWYFRPWLRIRTARETRKEWAEVRHQRYRSNGVHVVEEPDEPVAARVELRRVDHALSDEYHAIDERVRTFEVATIIDWIGVDKEDAVRNQRLRNSMEFEFL